MTPAVANEDFLRAIFGDEWPRAHVTSFAGDPGTAPRGAWQGGPAAALLRWATPDRNAFYTISLFHPDPQGNSYRRKALFQATHIIVVDDIGTKVVGAGVLDRLGAPSYRLETSPGNEQWGYLLDTPATEPARVNALLDGLVAKGLVPDGKDPGMKGVTRYARLPVGRNGKAKYGAGGFAHRLLEWEPTRRFTLAALAAPYSIDLDAPTKASRASVARAVSPGEDDVLAALHALGLVQAMRSGDVTADITCPFSHEHTYAADTGTAYLSGGGIRCHHGHCVDRTLPEYRARLAVMLAETGQPAFFAVRVWGRAAREERAALIDAVKATGTIPDAMLELVALTMTDNAVRDDLDMADFIAPLHIVVDIAGEVGRVQIARLAQRKRARRLVAAATPPLAENTTPPVVVRAVPVSEIEKMLAAQITPPRPATGRRAALRPLRPSIPKARRRAGGATP